MCPFVVAREHAPGCFQFAELAGEPLALRIDARERLTDPLLLFRDLVPYLRDRVDVDQN
jgi:hypothetical protein